MKTKEIIDWILLPFMASAVVFTAFSIKLIGWWMGTDNCQVCYSKTRREGSNFCSKECWSKS